MTTTMDAVRRTQRSVSTREFSRDAPQNSYLRAAGPFFSFFLHRQNSQGAIPLMTEKPKKTEKMYFAQSAPQVVGEILLSYPYLFA